MICEHCTNNRKIQTAVPSCFMPHCTKTIDELAKRYAQLYARWRTPEENAEYRMIKAELERRRNASNH